MTKRVTKENCLETCFPEISKEWHPTKNGDITPDMVNYGSGKKFWWFGKKCGHEWEASPNKRINNSGGCPICRGRMVTLENCLATTHPELCKEWDFEKNNLLPTQITKGCNKYAWWKCLICTYNWKARIDSRTYSNSKCPSCSGKIVTEFNNLLITHPNLCKEWHPTKNGNLTPQNVSRCSMIYAWWICLNKKCNNVWRTLIGHRTSGSNCPKCSKSAPISKSGIKWLDELKIPLEYREKELIINSKKYRVDAYDCKTNTIYEYFGNFWHGNPEFYKSVDINPRTKITFGELYSKTIERLNTFKENKYNVIFKWGK